MLPLSAYLSSASLSPSAGAEPARAADAALRAPDAAAWFADDQGDASQVLRAPAASASPEQGSELTQRFLACLCGS
jgi:hypothetical protein